jgi:hypothetical protein
VLLSRSRITIRQPSRLHTQVAHWYVSLSAAHVAQMPQRLRGGQVVRIVQHILQGCINLSQPQTTKR